jgi:hypothetical protein
VATTLVGNVDGLTTISVVDSYIRQAIDNPGNSSGAAITGSIINLSPPDDVQIFSWCSLAEFNAHTAIHAFSLR